MSHAGQSSSLIGTDGRRVHAGDCPCWQVWSVVRARNDYDMRGNGLSGYEGLLDDMVADRASCEGGVGTCWGTLDTLDTDGLEVTLAAAPFSHRDWSGLGGGGLLHSPQSTVHRILPG